MSAIYTYGLASPETAANVGYADPVALTESRGVCHITASGQRSRYLMAIFMKFTNIQGESKVEGFKEWTEILSFQFGVGRAIASANGTSTRESSLVSLSDVTITKLADATSVKFFEEALHGRVNRVAEIRMVRVGAGAPQAFMGYKLEGVGVASHSVSASGGPGVDSRPIESIALNFYKITMEYIPIGDDLTGSPSRYMWDMALSQGG